ncbi:MAG: hypothetical protein K9N48_00700 [Verrucomicrobia bacterium]|nr:hypothetical protein [Verrucomicrobiota bacterium]MCF7707320.1 hypothetical protein [Verrucomicrobiota bacterium]
MKKTINSPRAVDLFDNQINRRSFVKGCAGCAALAVAAKYGLIPAFAGADVDLLPKQKARVRLVFSHIRKGTPTWPHSEYDYASRKKELTAKLRESCPDVEFLPATAMNTDDAKKLLEQDKDVDGYLVYMMGLWTGAPIEIAKSGSPTLFVDDLYGGSGEFLIAYSEAKKKNLKVAGVSSSDFRDVVDAVRCFTTIKKLKHSLILDVTDKEELWGNPESITDVFGTKIKRITSKELNKAYSNADLDAAQKQRRIWTRNAARIIEPTKDEILRSGIIYQAMSDLMTEYKAQALAIDCLSLFYGGKLKAYPCLGLFQFNNDGLVGACEGDLQSTITMLIMNYLVGLPGFISDPVIDTSKNQIIYAHCVCTNKPFGHDAPSNPYHIRSHSEDRHGAAVRSLLPLDEITTTLEFNAERKEVIMHRARTVENIDEPKACRTKLAAEVIGDIDKLMTHWDKWGWHRVTFFGDLKRRVEHLSALMGFKVIEEA